MTDIEVEHCISIPINMNDEWIIFNVGQQMTSSLCIILKSYYTMTSRKSKKINS